MDSADAMPAPLIVTLGLDDATFRALDDLRRAHFPPERNFLSAHLTLFHHLPGERVEEVSAFLAELASTTPAPALRSTGWRFLGRGVALDFASPTTEAARAKIAARFRAVLTPQDQQKIRPHVTVQNKVDPAVARALHAELQAGFSPREATGEALLLWRYENGPWSRVEKFPFAVARTGL